MPSGVYERTMWHKERLKVPRPGSGRRPCPSGLHHRKAKEPGVGTGNYKRTKKEYIQIWNTEIKRFDVIVVSL